jgi:hypothetical protein
MRIHPATPPQSRSVLHCWGVRISEIERAANILHRPEGREDFLEAGLLSRTEDRLPADGRVPQVPRSRRRANLGLGGWPSLRIAPQRSGCPILRGFLRRVGGRQIA